MTRVTVFGAVLLVVVVVVILLGFIQQARLKANFVRSQNNMREFALFAAHHSNPKASEELSRDLRRSAKRDLAKLPVQIPAGTIVLPDVPPDSRLSWVVGVLPGLDQRVQDTAELLARIDQKKPWGELNQQAALMPVKVLICPENPPEVPPGSPAITCYVGIGGVGADPASLPLGSPKSGAFRYDGPTPFDRITDGLSQTLLFAETRNEVGPWLRGGSATIRGLNDAPDALPLVGGQFGGYFPNGGNFAMCDGGVRVFTPQAAPSVLLSLATISGKGTEAVPLE